MVLSRGNCGRCIIKIENGKYARDNAAKRLFLITRKLEVKKVVTPS